MRCSCQVCGEYMVQSEKGVESMCVCPNCFNTCSACMGNRTSVKSVEELKQLFLLRTQADGNENADE